MKLSTPSRLQFWVLPAPRPAPGSVLANGAPSLFPRCSPSAWRGADPSPWTSEGSQITRPAGVTVTTLPCQAGVRPGLVSQNSPSGV